MWKSFFILMQIKLIFTRKVVHLASFWKWRFLELGSGLFKKDYLIEMKNFSIRYKKIEIHCKNYFLCKYLLYVFTYIYIYENGEMIIYIKTYQKGTWIWICLICVVSAKMASWNGPGSDKRPLFYIPDRMNHITGELSKVSTFRKCREYSTERICGNMEAAKYKPIQLNFRTHSSGNSMDNWLSSEFTSCGNMTAVSVSAKVNLTETRV